MSRPDDVPSWRESTKRSWNWSKWLLILIPGAYVMAVLLPVIFFLEPTSAKQAQEMVRTVDFMKIGLPCVAAFMWSIIFLNGILNERAAKTPKEIEAKERHMLARLREKYPDA